MLEELLKLTGCDGDELDHIELIEVREDIDSLKLSLNVFLEGAVDLQQQSWEVECFYVLERQLTLDFCEQFGLFNHHVMLWPYLYPLVGLSFYGEAEDPHAVVGALYQQHVELTDAWLPFERFMNGNPLNMITGRYGLLAYGPVPLIESYAQVLKRYGISAGLTEPKPAEYANDELGLLTFGRNAYVVAALFEATRLS